MSKTALDMPVIGLLVILHELPIIVQEIRFVDMLSYASGSDGLLIKDYLRLLVFQDDQRLFVVILF